MFTILVVDDEPFVRTSMGKMLSQMEGVDEVYEADNGLDAMKVLSRQRVELVITDIRMPAADGLQLAEHIRSNYPETDVYVLTGHAEFDYALKAMKHQVTDYLLKPLSKRKLEEVCRSAYAKYRQRREAKKVNGIRSQALLEKRIHDLLHDVPLPTFDANLIPPYEKIVLASFSTRDLQSLGEASVRYFIRESVNEAFSRLGVPVVCLEDRLITVVLFAHRFNTEAWERCVKETAEWIGTKLRLEVKTGYGGCTQDIKDLSLLYIRSVVSLGFTEISRHCPENAISPIVKTLLAYVQREYAGEAHLADFAEQHQVNANYLSNLFHQEMGMTYSQYLTQYRLSEAKRLLKETRLKIYEVAERAGYRDPAYFSRIFKTFAGVSPNDFRCGRSFQQ